MSTRHTSTHSLGFLGDSTPRPIGRRFGRALLATALVAGWAALFAGCSADVGVEGSEANIVGGTRGGDPAVVWVYRSDGALCSGTLIDPRVVLTAKHCVQPSGAAGPSPASAFVVGIGDTAGAGGRVLRVQSVYTTPGVWSEGGATGLSGAIVGVDIGVLVLVSGVSDVTPIPIRRESPADLVGQTFTATGFGEIPSGGAGTKYTVTGRVRSVDTRQHLIYVGAVTCQGDSGGPLITTDNHVGGVVSFGNGACGSGIGAYQAIDAFLDIIDMAIREGGGCSNDGPEVCDGHDNDCNGQVDEVCVPLGGGCTNDADCVGGLCTNTIAGRICTAACDARRPTFGCEAGLFCGSSGGCDGYCVPIEGDHSLPNDASCTTSSECASFLCEDPGDGRRRCLSPCRGNAGECLAGEVCVASAGACGGCVPAALVASARGLGEPCTGPEQCLGGQCITDGGRQYCSTACTDDAGCGDGYHCRVDHCVAGPRGQAGDPCVFNTAWDDCQTPNQFCASLGSRSWCTEYCGASTPSNQMCPEGFDCVDVGGVNVCAPTTSLPGEACATGAECTSGLCITSPLDGTMVCSRECSVDSSCGTGFECARTADGTTAYCVVAPPLPRSSGGCSVGAPRRGGSAAAAGLLLSVFLVVRSFHARRRTARAARR